MPDVPDSINLIRYRKIINELPVLICGFLPGGEISFVNDSYCTYFNKTAEELVGSNFLVLIPDDHRKIVMENVSALTVDSPTQSHSHRVISPNGELKWQRWINHAIFDADGNVVEYHAIGEDITESKNAERMLKDSEELHRITLSNISDAVFITDDAGKFTYICPNAKIIFGYTDEEIQSIGNINKLLGGTLFKLAELESSNELKNIEHAIQEKSGKPHYLLVNVKRVSIMGGTILYTCRDVTERKKDKARLDKLKEKLIDRTNLAEQRAEYVQQLAMELTKAEDRERQRIANLLHDDLQQMLAYLKIKLHYLVKVNEITFNFNGITDLIDSCIDRCRKLSHELKPFVSQQIDFIDALKWICRQMKEHYGLEVSLQATAHPEIQSSVLSSLLVRSIRELLFNVVKHSGSKQASINVRVKDRYMLISVKDSGKGCDPSVLNVKREKGMAFGLGDIEERVNFLGGYTDIESSVGSGFSVMLWVPIDVYCPSETWRPAAVMPNGIKIIDEKTQLDHPGTVSDAFTSVVIADDHSMMRDGLAELINGHGDIRVVGMAANGKEAIELASKLKPMVILMDVNMPVMNGIESTTQIHASFPDIRIIGITMHKDPDIHEAMKNAGACACLTKSGSTVDLINTILAVHSD